MQQMIFYCRSYCLLNMFQAPLCPSSGAREYYTGALVFKLSVWCRAEGYALKQQPANWTHNPQLHTIPTTWKTKAPNTTGSNHLYNTLELLMMVTVVPETCWGSSKICNKNHLLHLVGILFPRINDDARSKSHQIVRK